MKVSLVIPFIEQYDVLIPTIQHAVDNAGSEFELVLISNNPLPAKDWSMIEKSYDHTYPKTHMVVNPQNIGVLPTYKQGYEQSEGDIVFYIHSDVLIHEKGWVAQLSKAFEEDPILGLVGIFGARGIGTDGGRMYSMSNMQGKEWGGCECHSIAAYHHGELIDTLRPSVILDGVGMAWRRETLKKLVDNTDAFAEWRAPHHFYDKILSLKTIENGYRVATIPLAFDHYSGATANRSEIYKKTMGDWLKAHNAPYTEGSEDEGIYQLAEKQMFDEYGKKFPITVDEYYRYTVNDN